MAKKIYNNFGDWWQQNMAGRDNDHLYENFLDAFDAGVVGMDNEMSGLLATANERAEAAETRIQHKKKDWIEGWFYELEPGKEE